MRRPRHVKFEVKDEVAEITLNRPQARNALSPEMTEDFDVCIAEVKARQGNGIHAVLLTGEGNTFCAGGDVKAMQEPNRKNPLNRRTSLRATHKRLYELLNLEVPVVAAVNGHASGAGFSFALMSDFIFASPSTRFANSFGRLGLIPDWACMYTLPRIVGLSRAKDLVFTGRQFDGYEAKTMGIVHEVIEDDRNLVPSARAFAKRFSDASMHSIGLAKTLLLQSFEHDMKAMLEFEAFGQGISYSNPYHAEAISRFVDKRPPSFDWDAY